MPKTKVLTLAPQPWQVIIRRDEGGYTVACDVYVQAQDATTGEWQDTSQSKRFEWRVDWHFAADSDVSALLTRIFERLGKDAAKEEWDI